MTEAENDLEAETRRLREETLRLLELSRAERLQSGHLSHILHGAVPCGDSGAQTPPAR